MAAWSAPNNDTPGHTALPQGTCNFKDLSREQAPTCPCRRFYHDRSRPEGRSELNDGAWCFCGHHACFHDHDRLIEPVRQAHHSVHSIPSASQFEEVESVVDITSERHISQEDTTTQVRPTSSRNIGLGLQHPQSQPGIWEALNAYAREQAGPGSDRSSVLPSTATPSVLPSQVSGSADAFMHHVRNFSSRRGLGPGLGPGQVDPDRINDAASATEINTPSIDGTPLIARQSPNNPAHITQPTQMRPLPQPGSLQADSGTRRTASAAAISPPRKVTASQNSNNSVDRRLKRPADEMPSVLELQNIVKACTQRLDLLESLSYTHVPLDEVEDKFEHIDGRLFTLEEFRTDIENRLPSQDDDESQRRRKRRLLPAEITTSFNSEESVDQGSDRSFSSAISATAAVYAEYSGRFDAMQQRLESLEKTAPSVSNPWRVELVLLPWGRHLPGIWAPSASMTDTHTSRRDSREEWNGTSANANGIFGVTVNTQPSGWSTDSIQAWADNAQDWLSPKACGPHGAVYRRLWSRGLVRDIEIDSPDAHTFMQRCKDAFRHVLSGNTHQRSDTSTKLEYDALREPIVPLRKVRKVSRLRFLSPSEMVTSALWTPSFLESSVFMKAKGHQRRLYLTFPEAYIQQTNDGWTWQTIRGLRPLRHDSPRAGPGFEGSGHSDADACWATHSTLDAAPFVDQSFTSNASRQSKWSTKSQASHGRESHVEDFMPQSALVSPVSQACTLRDYRRRTVSIPPSEGEPSSSAGKSKRRVASFETAALEAKRRRTSMSSQHPRPGPAHTPRLSREPPSPFASDYPTESRSDNASGRRVILTPLAYETPHSHTNNAAIALFTIDRDGDTDADTEIVGREQSQVRFEDEWQGVGDEQFFPPSQLDTARREETVIMRGSDNQDESELDE